MPNSPKSFSSGGAAGRLKSLRRYNLERPARLEVGSWLTAPRADMICDTYGAHRRDLLSVWKTDNHQSIQLIREAGYRAILSYRERNGRYPEGDSARDRKKTAPASLPKRWMRRGSYSIRSDRLTFTAGPVKF